MAIHNRDGRQICRNIAFNLLGNSDGLPFVAKAGQRFDQPAQKSVARDKQKKQNQYGLSDTGSKRACVRQ